MLACKTNNQLSCEQCEKYEELQDELMDKVRTIVAEVVEDKASECIISEKERQHC